MTVNLTQDIPLSPYGYGGRDVNLPQSANQIYKGAMVSCLSDGALITATGAGGGHVVGMAQFGQLGTSPDGTNYLTILTDKIFLIATGVNAPTVSTTFGTPLFAETDQTVGTLAGSTAVIAGRFYGLEPDGRARVYISPDASWFDGVVADVEPTNSRANYVRAVVTSIVGASYTGTGTGVLTFATGAMTTDGVSVSAGDVVHLQGGTLGSCAITAADTGPWVVTVKGATGVAAVFTRPAWYQTGQVLPNAYGFDVGTEGTLFGGVHWTMWGGAAVTIGTTDPSLYPDRVITQLTINSGVASALTTVPIRSASKSVVTAQLVSFSGGTPTGGTSINALVLTPGYANTASFVLTLTGTALADFTPSGAIVANVVIANR